MFNKKKAVKNYKLPFILTSYRPPLILTGLLFLLTILTYFGSKVPQCPPSYTQAQIDAAQQGFFMGCNVGADIGTGIMVMEIAGLTIVVIVLWILFIAGKLPKK